MTKILVTRPEPDAAETAGRVRAIGCEPVVFPLMRMQPTETRLPDAAGLSGLIVTSANAIRALEMRDALAAYLGLKVYAVGDRTAEAARAAGFADVESANGDAGDLIALVGERAGKAAGQGVGTGTLLYPSAVETARDLPKALASAGVLVIAAEIYAMVPAARLDDQVAHALASGDIAAVMIYSRRMAGLFAELTELVLSPERRRALTLICLSENVAAPLVSHGFPRIVLADFPSEEAMLAATLSFSRGQITS